MLKQQKSKKRGQARTPCQREGTAVRRRGEKRAQGRRKMRRRGGSVPKRGEGARDERPSSKFVRGNWHGG